MSETYLPSPGSTESLDPDTVLKMYDSMDMLGRSESQSLHNTDFVFQEPNSADSPIIIEKALAYGNIYKSTWRQVSSSLNIEEDLFASQPSPILFNEIEWDNHKFKLLRPLGLDINFVDELWEGENRDLDIFLVASDMDELIASFREEFFVIWEVYSREPDSNLTTKAQQIKENLLKLVTEVEIDGVTGGCF
ncbi:hypothetical protein C7960_0745 [Methanohalophilus euhalobius]|jgi:hypothetical protein|uniref:Uncharacterized protein n=1 Tax=Methanohalophilus euhalobius TaxID=51203 RepID=A0A285GC13_9EURY|nr:MULTISPECIES: hypothetical protein [Methanohalophilus]OBZ34819.1 MAG: hypothetical protein A9957_09385 [Methanohalophilus sp. DAL1]ODV48832.1 MAG: hypothetical protein A8273_1844 [Methanohalophilus sp. 2-GBenrich]TCL11581.1 hypothetical protein C7960_0745 [Methanohalophilus euhalobius]SNY20714.1 hypothetical protein SAMN06295989_11158 [Methanohalophilus euhalobius]